MTIGLANSAKRSRYAGTTCNQFQGAGPYKMGLPKQVGRDSWTSIALGATNVQNNHCLRLGQTKITMHFSNQSRPVYSWTAGNTHWHFA